MSIKFITRNEKGVLQQNLAYWDMFKDELLSKANNLRELEFIGQLIEDLQYEYEDKMAEMEEE